MIFRTSSSRFMLSAVLLLMVNVGAATIPKVVRPVMAASEPGGVDRRLSLDSDLRARFDQYRAVGVSRDTVIADLGPPSLSYEEAPGVEGFSYLLDDPATDETVFLTLSFEEGRLKSVASMHTSPEESQVEVGFLDLNPTASSSRD